MALWQSRLALSEIDIGHAHAGQLAVPQLNLAAGVALVIQARAIRMARSESVRRRKNEMYNKTLTAAFAVAILGSGAAFAADKPGADWITLEQAVEKAKAAGYTELHGIEADDDGWEGEGMKQDGKKYEFSIDGRTGEVTKEKED
jgi:uncharacterized membrane protein YkoI